MIDLNQSFTAIVLAAGQGTRMKSSLPKVVHPLAGRPLAYYPLAAAFAAGAVHAVVVTNGRPEIASALLSFFPEGSLTFVTQDPPRGTGDAVRVALGAVQSDRVLILCGDTPLLEAEDLTALLRELDQNASLDLAFLSCLLDNPSGYGRVLRNARGEVREIREHRDLASDTERATREVNAGVYAALTSILRSRLPELTCDNSQGEYYLTDLVRLLPEGRSIARVGRAEALVGVNDRAQLASAEEQLFARIRARHAKAGVTLRGDARIDEGVELDVDVTIEAGVRVRGKTRIGRGSRIDVGCVIDDARIGEDVVLKPYSIVSTSQIDDRAQIGPFAHLRPDSVIEAEAHIGNFVETKKTRVRRGAKANHLAYLGDGDVGERANLGAGTIFCNYDGFQKHRTVIGKGAFIGSDSQLVAPVTVGENAYVATGTTVTQDVPSDALAIGRIRQENKLGYAPRLTERLRARRDG